MISFFVDRNRPNRVNPTKSNNEDMVARGVQDLGGLVLERLQKRVPVFGKRSSGKYRRLQDD